MIDYSPLWETMRAKNISQYKLLQSGIDFTGEGRGFTFTDINANDMLWVIREAVDLYYNNKEAWRGLQKEGMTADFSWDHSAQEYLDIYQRIQG